ncbi:MAG: thermonuclease family protein [Isosphaeraceae bacterium]|jgi:endonuclease YncB( thermonuclease family)
MNIIVNGAQCCPQMMTKILLTLALLLPAGAPPKKCTGLAPCTTCTTCSRCKYCKIEGGTCGACQHPDNMVVRVIDGDTIVVQVNGHPETVGLFGVDTPETKDPRKPVEYFGKKASRFTASLLKGQQVRSKSRPTRRVGTSTAGYWRMSSVRATTC